MLNTLETATEYDNHHYNHHHHEHHHHHQPDYRNHLHAVSGPTESSYSRREKARTRETIIPTSTITTTPYTITNTTQYTPLLPSKERKSVFSQSLGPRPLFPDRHLIGPSNPNLSVLETLNSTMVPGSLAENVGKHAQQRRYGVPCADSFITTNAAAYRGRKWSDSERPTTTNARDVACRIHPPMHRMRNELPNRTERA